MIALGRIEDLKRLLAMRWARLVAWRDGNSHLRDGTCVGVSRVKGLEVPWHQAEHRPRDPHDAYLRDEDADLVVAAITLLPELLDEREIIITRARALLAKTMGNPNTCPEWERLSDVVAR